MEKKIYKKPQIKIFNSEAVDILTASGTVAPAPSGYAGGSAGLGFYSNNDTTTPVDPNMQ